MKTLTPEEFFKAVADGQRVSHKSWPAHEWMQLKGKIFVGENGKQAYPDIDGDENNEEKLDGWYIWPYTDELDELMPMAIHRRFLALEKEVVDLRQKLAGLGGV